MNNYPTEEQLKMIQNWDYQDPYGLMNFIMPLLAEHGWARLTGKRIKKLYLATGGWSGNEDIIQALQKNMFWSLWWIKSERGGAYTFIIKPIKK